jgi:hypothetical protein
MIMNTNANNLYSVVFMSAYAYDLRMSYGYGLMFSIEDLNTQNRVL